MKTQVTFRHVKSQHPHLQEMAIEEVENFEKYYDGIISANVEFNNEHDKIVIFTVQVNGTTLVAKEETDDFKKSLNLASHKIVRQLSKLKTKHLHSRAKQAEAVLE